MWDEPSYDNWIAIFWVLIFNILCSSTWIIQLCCRGKYFYASKFLFHFIAVLLWEVSLFHDVIYTGQASSWLNNCVTDFSGIQCRVSFVGIYLFFYAIMGILIEESNFPWNTWVGRDPHQSRIHLSYVIHESIFKWNWVRIGCHMIPCIRCPSIWLVCKSIHFYGMILYVSGWSYYSDVLRGVLNILYSVPLGCMLIRHTWIHRQGGFNSQDEPIEPFWLCGLILFYGIIAGSNFFMIVSDYPNALDHLSMAWQMYLLMISLPAFYLIRFIKYSKSSRVVQRLQEEMRIDQDSPRLDIQTISRRNVPPLHVDVSSDNLDLQSDDPLPSNESSSHWDGIFRIPTIFQGKLPSFSNLNIKYKRQLDQEEEQERQQKDIKITELKQKEKGTVNPTGNQTPMFSVNTEMSMFNLCSPDYSTPGSSRDKISMKLFPLQSHRSQHDLQPSPNHKTVMVPALNLTHKEQDGLISTHHNVNVECEYPEQTILTENHSVPPSHPSNQSTQKEPDSPSRLQNVSSYDTTRQYSPPSMNKSPSHQPYLSSIRNSSIPISSIQEEHHDMSFEDQLRESLGLGASEDPDDSLPPMYEVDEM